MKIEFAELEESLELIRQFPSKHFLMNLMEAVESFVCIIQHWNRWLLRHRGARNPYHYIRGIPWAIAKVRDMRFRYAKLVYKKQVEADIISRRGDMVVNPPAASHVTKSKRDYTKVSKDLSSHVNNPIHACGDYQKIGCTVNSQGFLPPASSLHSLSSTPMVGIQALRQGASFVSASCEASGDSQPFTFRLRHGIQQGVANVVFSSYSNPDSRAISHTRADVTIRLDEVLACDRDRKDGSSNVEGDEINMSWCLSYGDERSRSKSAVAQIRLLDFNDVFIRARNFRLRSTINLVLRIRSISGIDNVWLGQADAKWWMDTELDSNGYAFPAQF
ncbi:uncharacterized protein PHALS_07511 [Plasmopara halstedii]|uniref:Uncharacterized protein n=1 Tax=Plasmopara halstedii TaxID=4781 RepID=A0A0P1B5Z7_PLAHL|nr:uncharacterized protein PHALS_07511 [Plasmopara halstedii]CEG49765.1 hypothetical protein PHALS_07511 [Plasmopara halstedii]|eukprot:XP_024586134.1 hypothetical protein PHALS_07511 [Plasmopara halstedii]